MKVRNLLCLSFIVNLVFCFSVVAQQKTSIQLTGRIFDLNGSVIPGIKIVAYSQKNGKYEQITDGDGVYLLNLPSGIYNLDINRQDIKYNGFECLKFKNYLVVPAYDGKISLDFSLSTLGNGVISQLRVSDFSLYMQSKRYKKHKTKKGLQV